MAGWGEMWQQVEAGIRCILEVWNVGCCAVTLVRNTNALKIHKECVERAVTVLGIKE